MCGSTNGIIDLFISHPGITFPTLYQFSMRSTAGVPERLLTKYGTRQKFQTLSNAITVAIDIHSTSEKAQRLKAPHCKQKQERAKTRG